MPGFPSGWTFAQTGGGGSVNALIIPAAAANIRRVITDVEITVVNGAAGVGAYQAFLQVGVAPPYAWVFSVDLTAPSQGGISESGLTLVSAPGTAVTVQLLTPTPAACASVVTVKGYDQ